MAKASNSDVKNFGFSFQMFELADEAALDAYIDAILTDISSIVSDRVGSSTYTAATGADAARLKKAETYFAAAELYRRREGFERSEIDLSGQDNQGPPASLYLQSAKEFEALAETELGNVNTGYPGSGIAVGFKETGPYTATT